MEAISLPAWPWQTVQRIAARRGASVWLVGGAVRDALLGRTIHDWDFAVDRDALGMGRAVADELEGAFYPLDAARDTGRALVTRSAGQTVSLDFAGLRGPDVRLDLAKRDFTINALAIDQAGLLIDPTDGVRDIDSGAIRMASSSAFSDDPLRLLRAVRIAGELQFAIEPTTLAAMRRASDLLAAVSAERKRDELVRLLALSNAGAPLRLATELGLLAAVVPEVAQLRGIAQSLPHRFDAWEHSLLVLDTAQAVMNTVMGLQRQIGTAGAPHEAWDRLALEMAPFTGSLTPHLAARVDANHDRMALLKVAALMHDVGKSSTSERDADGSIHFFGHGPVGSAIASTRMRRLRFSRDAAAHVALIVRHHLRPAELARATRLTRRAVYRYFRDLGSAGVDVVILSLADHLATWGPDLQEARWRRRLQVGAELLDRFYNHYDEQIAPPTLITGRDLIDELQLAPGPELGRILGRIREAQAAREISTRDEALELASRMADNP